MNEEIVSKMGVIEYGDFENRYQLILDEINKVTACLMPEIGVIDPVHPDVILVEDVDSDLAMVRGLYWRAIWGEVLDSDLRRFTKTGEVLTMEQLKEKCDGNP